MTAGETGVVQGGRDALRRVAALDLVEAVEVFVLEPAAPAGGRFSHDERP